MSKTSKTKDRPSTVLAAIPEPYCGPDILDPRENSAVSGGAMHGMTAVRDPRNPGKFIVS